MIYADKISLLNRYLDTDSQAFEVTQRDAFDRISGPGPQRVVLFGAGRLGKKCLAALRAACIETIAFADSNPEMQGSTLDGIPVLSLTDAARQYGRDAVFVISVWRAFATETFADRRRMLTELGCQRVCSVFPLFLKQILSATCLPHCTADEPVKVIRAADRVRAALALLSDDTSRLEFVEQVLWRIDPERFALSPPTSEPIYFPPDLVRLSDKEVYVDCGGFDGDTARAFIKAAHGKFERIYIVEPDWGNFANIEAWLRSAEPSLASRVEPINMALGDEQGMVRFECNASLDSQVSSTGTVEIPCETLDKLLADARPTLMKMDIEGAELRALKGAGASLRKHRPVLMICLYHTQSDIWEIPLLIHQLAEGYSLYLRNHGLDGWDLVCYAVPPERLMMPSAER